MTKASPSLRLHILGSLLVLGAIVVVTLSFVSIQNTMNGMDMIMRGSMAEFVDSEPVSDGRPVVVARFTIASRWQDLPAEVRVRFEVEPRQAFEFIKSFDDAGYFRPPKAAFFVLLHPNKEGQLRYISRAIYPHHNAVLSGKDEHLFLFIIVSGLSIIGLFTVLLLMIMKRASSPMKKLHDWAENLDHQSLQLPPPDFQYKEINHLASIVHSSLNSVQESLEREHEFLRHASHELRTPIAVICANTELLNKINTKFPVTEKQQNVIRRIERAGQTMGYLTETLLWLSRDEDLGLHVEQVKLDVLVSQLFDEHQYLLSGKDVKIALKVEAYTLETPVTACRIVLSNLIRNAFQHTQNGIVFITQYGGEVEVRSEHSYEENTQSELGFGLGLKLTDKLISRFDWQYHVQVSPLSHCAKVRFDSKHNENVNIQLEAD